MQKFFLTLLASIMSLGVAARSITVTWPLGNPDNLSEVSIIGDDATKALISTCSAKGSNISSATEITKSTADTDFTPVDYIPSFTAFTPATKVTSKADGHFFCVTVTPVKGHNYKLKSISFDAMKVGTDGGTVDVYYRIGTGTETAIATGVSPLRNKITTSNTTAFSHHEYTLGDVIADGEYINVYFYIMGINGADNSSPKQIAFRNITLVGAVDEESYSNGTLIKSFSCTGATSMNGGMKKFDLLPAVSNLAYGKTVYYPTKFFGEPDDINLELIEGYNASKTFDGHNLAISIYKNGDEANDVTSFNINFNITNRQPKPAATPLKRGLMALSLSGASMGSGNLVSWRHRAADGYGVKYKLYRIYSNGAETILNNGLYIIDRTNFQDTNGSATNKYRLETYDKAGRLLEEETCSKTWSNQTLDIPTEEPAASVLGATYSPNDASYCDMDGDGEYEIILKWSPSDEKDAASTGATSPVYFDCIKLDGTRLWRICTGPNFFTSAHTMQFIAWDFDGDGYGEFMVKTAPGTVDGEGNYVLLEGDDPTVNLLGSNGKQTSGPEYITVFDGLTGGELATIPYHTDYAAGASYWGDTKQNRSERYLAALAYLDGTDANPSPIFARGYYSGAFVCAYDWDGATLKERWVSRNTTSGQGLWGEGAHWISVGDCDGDGYQEIIYGSAALDHDGSLLYRTGLGHGDALHLGDFLPDRPGMEVFMVHEEKPYGYDLRDAKTGEFILYQTASGDTGRGLAAHFDDQMPRSQFLYSGSTGVFDCLNGSMLAEKWTIGGSGAGINNRIYWNGDLYDEFFDKSIIAHWNHAGGYFDRYKVNNGNYTIGTLNNSSKFNPCVLGDLLGDWREEIVTWDGNTKHLIINATSYPTSYRLPHLMDDLNYRVQVVNQNCCYNQPPHLSFDPSVVYAGNPNVAKQEEDYTDLVIPVADTPADGRNAIYTLQGVRIDRILTPGVYIINGVKTVVK